MRIILTIVLFLIALTGMAQLKQDTVRPVKKRFGWAVGELAVSELIPWSYNHFVRKAEFSNITFKSIGKNLNLSNWEWDDNSFQTNQFAHPYHGNLYYSAFRTNGYSFWQSAPVAFAGSFLWEVAGETHKGAPNDFINTSLGGIALGEMSYRLAGRIIDNRATGLKRQLQEIFGLLVNPTNGLNRITRGEWGHVYGPRDTSNLVNAYVNVGVRQFGIHTYNQVEHGNSELYFRLRLNYGDKFEISSTPFSYFFAQIEAGSGDSTYLNTVQVNGALKTWRLREDSSQVHIYTVTMNYDFIKNGAFQYGGQSFLFKLISNWSKRHKTKITTEIGSGIVVLGAVPDKYLFYGEGRNYDYGPGITFAANTNINFNNCVELDLNYKGSRFKTVNGSKSSYILNTLSADLRGYVDRFSLTAGVGQYTLNGFYTKLQNVAEIYPFARLSVGYRL
jgi:Domain of unknown function (DUF3943)